MSRNSIKILLGNCELNKNNSHREEAPQMVWGSGSSQGADATDARVIYLLLVEIILCKMRELYFVFKARILA